MNVSCRCSGSCLNRHGMQPSTPGRANFRIENPNGFEEFTPSTYAVARYKTPAKFENNAEAQRRSTCTEGRDVQKLTLAPVCRNVAPGWNVNWQAMVKASGLSMRVEISIRWCTEVRKLHAYKYSGYDNPGGQIVYGNRESRSAVHVDIVGE